MKNIIGPLIVLAVSSFIFGVAGAFFVFGIKHNEAFEPLNAMKAECEKNIPRDKKCVVKFVPQPTLTSDQATM